MYRKAYYVVEINLEKGFYIYGFILFVLGNVKEGHIYICTLILY